MSGASFTAELDDAEAKFLFASIKAKGRSPRPVLNEIGSILEDSARNRFDTETDPDGMRWAPISDDWKREKARRGFSAGVLKMRGDLLNSVRAEPATDEAVEIVATTPYAAIHQKGGTIRPRAGKRALLVRGRFLSSVRIPRRSYLGVSAEDRLEIVDAAQDFLDRLSGR